MTKTHLRWQVAGGQSIAIVGHTVDSGGWLRAFVFGVTAAQRVDLLAFTIKWVGADDTGDEFAAQIATSATSDPPGRGLTSRQIRLAASHGGLVTEARNQLAALIPRHDADGMTGASSLVQYVLARVVADPDLAPLGVQMGRRESSAHGLARFVLDYDKLIQAPTPRARAKLAELYGISETAVKERLRKAKSDGLWATSGGGKPGQPTPLAYALASEEEN